MTPADDTTIDGLLMAAAAARPAIAGYQLHEPLGSGGEADVYRATVTYSEFEVAVKVFRVGNPARFHRQVVALTRLNHPHAVTLLDSGTTLDGRPYLTMPLFPKSLDRRFPTPGSLAPAAVAELVATVADATHAAHQLGIIHRDIKPSNVLVDADDRPRLSDFGLALVADETGVTHPGAVLGSHLYMSPEQAKGDSHQATVQTDVYGLGTVLYWLLTGRPPFESAPLAVLLPRVICGPPRPLTEVTTPAGRRLAAIGLKCLAKDPADRYPSAAALAAALRAWETTARPRGPGLFTLLRRWWGQLPLAVRVLTGVVTLLVVVAAASGLSAWSANTQAELDHRAAEAAIRQADLDRQAADLAVKEKTIIAEARARVAVRNALDRGWQLLRAKQAGWTPLLHADLAEVYRESRDLKDDDREAARLEARSLYAMSLSCVDIEPVAGGRLDMPSVTVTAWPVAPHPDGKWIAVGTPQGPFRFQPGEEPKKPENLALPPHGQRMPRLAYSPDGKVLAFAPATGGLQLWDGTVSRMLNDLDTGGPPVLAVGFAPGVVRACRTDGRVISWKDGKKTESESVGELTAARFTADASKLAVGDKSGKVREFTANGRHVRDWDGAKVRTEVQSLAWAPNGNGFAAGFQEGVVIAWNTDGTVQHRFAVSANGVDVLDYSADGGVLSANRFVGNTYWWDVETGEQILHGQYCHVSGPGSRPVAMSGVDWVQLARWVQPQVVRALRGHRADVSRLVWPSSGDFLASLDGRREVRVWDTTTGRLIDRVEAPVGDFYAENAGLALSPAGRYLAYSCGGRPGTKGTALVRDTSTRVTLKEWEIPAGFDRLAWESADRFVMVREEFVGDTQVLETVVRHLEPDRPPEKVRILRRPRPTDTRRYLEAILTPDGRHYIWWGPRVPNDRQRVEVYDVASEELLAGCDLPPRPNGDGADVQLSPCGDTVRVGTGDVRVWQLPASPGQAATPLPAEAWYRGDRWTAGLLNASLPSLFPPGQSAPWLHLRQDVHHPEWMAFSHNRDARRLAWAVRGGTIFTADLRELATAVERFEACHR